MDGMEGWKRKKKEKKKLDKIIDFWYLNFYKIRL